MNNKKELLTEGWWLDLGVLYFISKKLITPFNKWKAFSLGIIDADGRTLRKNLKTSEEKDAWTYLDKFIRNLRITLGNGLFLGLSLTTLLLIDYKSKLMKEEKSSPEDSLFKCIKESITSKEVAIDIMLSAAGESIYFYCQEDLGKLDLNIAMMYGGEIMSRIGGLMMPKTSTILFLDRLNYIFNNLDLGGCEEIPLSDGENIIPILVNYGANEIRVSGMQSSDSIQTDLFLIFAKDEQKGRFINGWNQFYSKMRAI